MKEKLYVFLSRYSLSTHSIVAFSTVLVTMYYEVPQVHDYVYDSYTHLPAGLKNFISVLIVAAAWYWRGKKVWTPLERAEKTPVVGSAPPGTSAGGDNAPVEVSVTPSSATVPTPVVVPTPSPQPPPASVTVPMQPSAPAAPAPTAPAPALAPSTKPPTSGW